MKTVTTEFVKELIDFAPTEETKKLGFAQDQLDGTVAIFNMLARNRCAYLADEVGMGKTYVALGVMSLMRYFNPKARIVVIAPRENIQQKWQKELLNFVQHNWTIVGNRVKSLQGGPTWEPVVCGSLLDFAHQAILNSDRDFFLRMTSFSVSVRQEETRRRLRRKLRQLVPWMPRRALSARRWDEFRDEFGCALNAVIRDVDLVVVDEGHNLKHGFREKGSIRNRVMGLAFGHPEGRDEERDWYGPRAKRVLLLSATPFEEEYGAINRQFSIFGLGNATLHDANGANPVQMRDLVDSEVSESKKREVVGRLMLRRVSGLRIAGKHHTKNMYRREWRCGGLREHDNPMRVTDPKQRLVVALMQKKVAEVLQSERFGNHFQIGMLSSFESFLESVSTVQRRKKRLELEEDESQKVFDGDQDADAEERLGIDSHAIGSMVTSYRRRFGRALPHPKLDATSGALSDAFETGEKTLVFVRRVATVRELAAKLDDVCDEWIRQKMETALPGLRTEIAELFDLYDQERRIRPEERVETTPVNGQEPESDDEDHRRGFVDDADEGSAETFFAWFFRGKGPEGYLSGAAYQKNRLSSTGSVYATLFEEDHVSWLLGRPADPLAELGRICGLGRHELASRLTERSYQHFLHRTRRKDQYPRLYVFQSYQMSGLELLAETGGELGEKARIVLEERYPDLAMHPPDGPPPAGFPEPAEAIGVDTFFTELVRREDLRRSLWPAEKAADFRQQFRRREQRRELLSAMSRLGATYIDLYLLGIEALGSFGLRQLSGDEGREADLAAQFVDLLDRQRREDGFHAYRELALAAETFDLIHAVNFPKVARAPLFELAAIYGATLQRQVPVGSMAGGVNKRLVRQFRMPGFPLVLVATDVLQEGEDLHTFCRRVVHYGITWTPSAMEQRTGRIDRIGSLVQRTLDGREDVPSPDELLQVYYPHLRDTVEVLQIRRVLKRLNRFFRLIHESSGKAEDRESRINIAQEILDDLEEITASKEPLKSAFPVQRQWLRGNLKADDAIHPDVPRLRKHMERLWQDFRQHYAIDNVRRQGENALEGVALLVDSRIATCEEREAAVARKRFRLTLRSQAAGDATLLRCVSHVGKLNLTSDEALDHLYELQKELHQVKICARRNLRDREDMISVEGDILFEPETADPAELEALVSRAVCSAARLRAAFHIETDDR